MQQVVPFQEIIEALITQLGAHYVFPEHVPAIAASLRQHLEQGSYDDTGDGELLFFDAFAAEHIQLNGQYDRRTGLVYQNWVFPYIPRGVTPSHTFSL
jgi:hypothetical protein